MKHYHVVEHPSKDGSLLCKEYLFNLNKGFDLYLFQQATFTHSEYSTAFDNFLDENNLLGWERKGDIHVSIAAKGYNDVTGSVTVYCHGPYRRFANETARIVLDYISREVQKEKQELEPKPKVLSNKQKRRLAAEQRKSF